MMMMMMMMINVMLRGFWRRSSIWMKFLSFVFGQVYRQFKIFLVSLVFCRFQRAKPIIIDPGLYMNRKSDIFWATQRRALPTAYRLFTGVFFVFGVVLLVL